MNCEVCGRRIDGVPYKAIIEGARLVVCHDCALLGSISWELRNRSPPLKPQVKKLRSSTARSKQVVTPRPLVETNIELVQDFGLRIKRAREEQELTPEELGRKINEKASVLKKLENQKMRPADRLAKKLERALRIQLLAPTPPVEASPKEVSKRTVKHSVTLGDLIKKQPSEETE